MKEMSVEFNKLTDAYAKQQQNLVKEIISITATYFPILEMLNQWVAHLDVLLSFSIMALQAPTHYVRPTLLPLGKFP